MESRLVMTKQNRRLVNIIMVVDVALTGGRHQLGDVIQPRRVQYPTLC
jgi:hypothetical protein